MEIFKQDKTSLNLEKHDEEEKQFGNQNLSESEGED